MKGGVAACIIITVPFIPCGCLPASGSGPRAENQCGFLGSVGRHAICQYLATVDSDGIRSRSPATPQMRRSDARDCLPPTTRSGPKDPRFSVTLDSDQCVGWAELLKPNVRRLLTIIVGLRCSRSSLRTRGRKLHGQPNRSIRDRPGRSGTFYWIMGFYPPIFVHGSRPATPAWGRRG